MPVSTSRPGIFGYHDYRVFLRDWLAYRKASQPGFSQRQLASRAGLAAGYLPMVLSGKRPLTAKAWAKLVPFCELTASEQSFFDCLLTLGTSDSPDARMAALDRMKRFQLYQKASPREAEVYQYLAHWYHVAIREMAGLPGFRLDAAWIQKALRVRVPLKEIQEALGFLRDNGYLEVAKDGSVHPPQKSLDCTGGIYRIALARFHREIFDLASQAIENAPSDERNIQGHTLALSARTYLKAHEIVEEAMTRIRALGEGERNSESVYHLEIALFPLTQTTQKRKKSE